MKSSDRGSLSARPPASCPVCGGRGRVARELTASALRNALEEFTDGPVPDGIGLRDYRLRRCEHCTLEFADPMEPAPGEFYAWLDERGRYYLKNRWEWDRVCDWVRAASGGAPTVLEIGAGDGSLLLRLKEAGARVAAIERSPEVAAGLRAKGIEAYSPEEARDTFAGRTFDFVLAFHCLEHVSQPLELLQAMRASAGPRGRVLFSVPYSPMYFERGWFDPLNHPPHHLTRWNQRALGEAASRAGAGVRLHLPPALGALRRARYTLAIRHLGSRWAKAPGWRWLPLRHPLQFTAELAAQSARERVNGRAAADVVLAELVAD